MNIVLVWFAIVCICVRAEELSTTTEYYKTVVFPNIGILLFIRSASRRGCCQNVIVIYCLQFLVNL